ncbi:MAG: hypothetical protein MK106_10860 [Mariniblastus sp.]|nr:hypothetical protein [Mariniblastus sp.]
MESVEIYPFFSPLLVGRGMGHQVAAGLAFVICELYVKEMAGIEGLIGLETCRVKQLKRSVDVSH